MTRRDFLITSALATVPTASTASAQSPHPRAPAKPAPSGSRSISWLDGSPPAANTGLVWGLPWPEGELSKSDFLTLETESGDAIPMQTWTAAYWPDGSVKWSAHAIPSGVNASQTMFVSKGQPTAPVNSVSISDRGAYIVVDTGKIKCHIPIGGPNIFSLLERDGKAIAENGRLIGYRQDKAEFEPGEESSSEAFQGETESVVVEQDGPVRAVVKIQGRHRTRNGRKWLPFTVRLCFFANGESVRITHTFIYDGDDQRDFIKGLGLRFDAPQNEELHNRHVRFVGEGSGLWAEAVRGLTGLRRDPGDAVREAQIDGRATPPLPEWDRRVSDRVQYIPAWGDFTLAQLSANGFAIRKRTKPGHGWIDVDQGSRASGVAYVGGASGGLLFGMRDFWQLHPTQIDIRSANTERAEATVWIWSPEAPAMDVRFYHDGLGMDTYEKQYDGGLEITYEDYEPGFGTAHGVARTSDFTLYALGSTPSREATIALADTIRNPALLTATCEAFLESGVFGGLWSLPDRSTSSKAKLEDRLDWSVQYYRDQVDQRHWYGFWNYGDVMHTYDRDRHVWRYDVGGYAWDNSELSPDLWLWYSFLRTGRRDEFRLAEAMTRHTRDVDIYHLGEFAGLGTRHNVQHWGCSAKQLRISTAAYRRFHYFLTADERTGDVLREVVEADQQLATLNPSRKLKDASGPGVTRIGIGTDFGSAAANWLTAWERTGDPKYRGWLEDAMRAIGGHELGFFAGDFGYDPETRKLLPPGEVKPSISHLSAVFGLVEVCSELTRLIDVPEFNSAWLQYCTLHGASREDQVAALGHPLGRGGLRSAHSRLTAYAAHMTSDRGLARRAWSELEKTEQQPGTLDTQHIEGPTTLNSVEEAAWVSTNDSAQWGLAAIQNLALIPDAL